MIILKNIGLSLSGHQILSDLNLAIDENQITTIIGPSGCGKSTLLRLIAGLLMPSSGDISIKSTEKSSFVFQEPRLLPWLTVTENILLPFKLNKSKTPKNSDLIITQVGLWKARQLYPHQLSGGMKMRVSLARALITKPSLVLMDEPFSSLDESTRFDLQDLLLEIYRQSHMTVIFVTHSLSEAVYLAHRVLLMNAEGGKFKVDRKLTLQELPVEGPHQLRNHTEYIKEIKILSAALRTN